MNKEVKAEITNVFKSIQSMPSEALEYLEELIEDELENRLTKYVRGYKK